MTLSLFADSRDSDGSQAGARTQGAGIVVFVVVLMTQAVLLPLFSPLPRGVMAAIIFAAAISLVHFDQIAFMVSVRGQAAADVL